jgi:hypothetical protein
MIIEGDNFNKRFLSLLVCLIWLIVFSGCAGSAEIDLTLTNPYAQVVGNEYRIVAPVDAYGIYEDLDKKVITYITLIPGVGIAGPEVAFKKRISKGQKIKILSAWRERKLLHSNVYYIISLQQADIPNGIKIRIDLSRGNEGVGAELNNNIYEKITR